MSTYTTGELAKLCGVSVRTVQYYDDRGILVPSALSEGGRRLYSEDDLSRMHIICFLRRIGLSIGSVAAVLAEEDTEKIVTVLLDEQAETLREELASCRERLELIEGVRRELKALTSVSFESIGDVAHIVKQRKKLGRMRLMMVLTGIPVTVLQWASIALWITNGLWWLFAIYVAVAIPWGCAVSSHYFSHVSYLCPGCHKVFKPRLREILLAYHTPRMRRLHCPECGRHGLCVEIYTEKETVTDE